MGAQWHQGSGYRELRGFGTKNTNAYALTRSGRVGDKGSGSSDGKVGHSRLPDWKGGCAAGWGSRLPNDFSNCLAS